MSLKAIVFDLDGTLAETDEIQRNAFNAAFREAGVSWIWAPAAWARLRRVVQDADKIELFAQHNELKAPSAGAVAEILALKSRIELSLLESGGASLRPGVARLITEARLSGVKLAICARSGRTALDFLLFNRFGPDGLDWFDVIVTADDFDEIPTPLQAYAKLTSRLKVDPNSCIAIEDDQDGVDAAALSGFRVIATPGLYTGLGDFSRASLVVSDLGRPSDPFEVIQGNLMHASFVSVPVLLDWMGTARKAA